MRTFLDKVKWIGKWIAGFSGINAGGRRNALVYLMRVSQAFYSYNDYWTSKDIPMETKLVKVADRNRFGDFYQPGDKLIDPYSYRSYKSPIENHVHAQNSVWHKDIDYEGCGGRRASLLIGDPGNSFLWNHPMIYSEYRLHRGQRKSAIDALLSELRVYA